MFPAHLYSNRRKKLSEKLTGGIVIFLGNSEVPYNYRSNTYHFRQDSTFSYFFGLNDPDLAGIIDIDEDKSVIFGNDIDIEDIIWMGNLPTLKERALRTGVDQTYPLKKLGGIIQQAQNTGRKIHYLPPYRGEGVIQLENLLNISRTAFNQNSSAELRKAIIDLRMVKDEFEIGEIEKMVEVAYNMHTQVMRNAKPGVSEKTLAGAMEGIALSQSNGVSFPIILSQNGETLHNHDHSKTLTAGRLLLTDAGSESELLYASDITRTIPVGGKFSPLQKDIYNIVLDANIQTLAMAGPQTSYQEVHLNAARIIASGLKDMGFMKGNVDDAVEAGAHALFFPHGLGHALGMDVHDLEGLGEDYVGYDESYTRSNQFGLAYLRFARKPQPGYVLTNEPGIYFIPELIDLWKSEKKFQAFIPYDKVENLKGFGGIRIEDDILITEKGCRLLGKPIPKTVREIEDIMTD